MTEPTDGEGTQAKGSTFLRVAYARLLQEAQKSLRNQLRKNPHRPRRLSLAGRARVGVRTHGFFCRRHKSNSSGRSFGSGVMASRVPFAGRSPRQTSMNDYDTTAVASAPGSSPTGTQWPEPPRFPPRVPTVPMSSLPDGNSQTAGRRLDTSLSSRSSRRSQGWYRHVQRLGPAYGTPSLLNDGNYGNSWKNSRFVLRFVSSRRFRTRRELRELGGEL